MPEYSIPRPQASIKTQADIVFCIDSTGSMQPCINNVVREVAQFIDGLMSAAQVDYRLRLIGYRDHHDRHVAHEPWQISDFTNSVDHFKYHLKSVVANGGGDDPESALDALYLALNSKWRTSRTHKTIVLMTDADSHPTISRSVYARPDNNISRIIQDFQEMRHAMLFIVAPPYPIYRQLERAMTDADRKTFAHWVPMGDERYKGLSAVEFGPLLGLIGRMVSATSIVVATET